MIIQVLEKFKNSLLCMLDEVCQLSGKDETWFNKIEQIVAGKNNTFFDKERGISSIGLPRA